MNFMNVANANKPVIPFKKLNQGLKNMSKNEKEFVVQPAAPRDKANDGKYVPKRKGIPVPPGYTFQDLSKAQRDEYFNNQESAWKKEYNKKRGTISAMSTLTRGE